MAISFYLLSSIFYLLVLSKKDTHPIREGTDFFTLGLKFAPSLNSTTPKLQCPICTSNASIRASCRLSTNSTPPSPEARVTLVPALLYTPTPFSEFNRHTVTPPRHTTIC